MANDENLVPHRMKKNSEESARKQHNGGVASGIARRRKRSMQETARFILSMPMKQGKVDTLDELETIGKATKGANLIAGDEVLLALFKKSRKGDVKATELLMKILGEDVQTSSVSPLESLSKEIDRYKEMDDENED